MNKAIRTTAIGGLIFLLPIIFIVIIPGRAFEFAKIVATPICRIIAIERLAGLTARSSAISDRVTKLDSRLRKAIPRYQPAKKGFVDSVSQRSFEDDRKVVLVGKEEGQRFLGFEVERLVLGDVAVFQLFKPNTRSGFVRTVPPERFERHEIDPRELTALLRSHGIGLSETV